MVNHLIHWLRTSPYGVLCTTYQLHFLLLFARFRPAPVARTRSLHDCRPSDLSQNSGTKLPSLTSGHTAVTIRD